MSDYRIKCFSFIVTLYQSILFVHLHLTCFIYSAWTWHTKQVCRNRLSVHQTLFFSCAHATFQAFSVPAPSALFPPFYLLAAWGPPVSRFCRRDEVLEVQLLSAWRVTGKVVHHVLVKVDCHSSWIPNCLCSWLCSLIALLCCRAGPEMSLQQQLFQQVRYKRGWLSASFFGWSAADWSRPVANNSI